MPIQRLGFGKHHMETACCCWCCPREGVEGGSLSFDAESQVRGGGHHVETTDVRSLEMRGEGLSGACLGMLHGHGYRKGISVGFIRVTIHCLLTNPVQ